eukprot:1117565-Amorphochlora_amoeboformis.AAC.1
MDIGEDLKGGGRGRERVRRAEGRRDNGNLRIRALILVGNWLGLGWFWVSCVRLSTLFCWNYQDDLKFDIADQKVGVYLYV